MREAFREKRTVPQLLHAFYSRRQLDGEGLREFSHALSQLLNSVLQQSPPMVANAQLALRDQFVEGVRDSTLRRELRRLLRERPESSLFDVRNEAMMWALEDQTHHTSVAKNRKLVSDHTDMTLEKRDMTTEVQTDLSVTLREVVKIIAQQRLLMS